MTVISYRRHRFPPSVIQHDLAGPAPSSHPTTHPGVSAQARQGPPSWRCRGE